MASFYYTDGHLPRVQKYNSGTWILVVKYKTQFVTKSKARDGRSVDKKFRIPGIGPTFHSLADANRNIIKFRRHVEKVVRGDKPIRSHYGLPARFETTPDNFQRSQRLKRQAAQNSEVRSREVKRLRKITLNEAQQVRREDWQNWRKSSISILDKHVKEFTTLKLLEEPPVDGMRVSAHVKQVTHQKALTLMVFLKKMHSRDTDQTHFELGGKRVSEIRKEVASELSCGEYIIQTAYKEWRDGHEIHLATREAKVAAARLVGGNVRDIEEVPLGLGSFKQQRLGHYERSFLLEEEDLKVEFKMWMRSNIRKLTVEKAWVYLNSTLLKNFDENTLLANRICLPVSKDTAWRWMERCGACRCDTNKTYYNDQHQSADVVAYRKSFVERNNILKLRMKVWVRVSEEEEQQYMECRRLSSFSDAMPEGEKIVIDNVVHYIHHMDDQEKWETRADFHPSFSPGEKPTKANWNCKEGHAYGNCLCHCELREYGQDESIYRSGDYPSSRWGLDGRSYPISKSQGVSKMVSAFKDYSKRGMGLYMSAAELAIVNTARVGITYRCDGEPMLPLLESPGLRIITPTKAADGYWDYTKMAIQTEDTMHSLDVLEPEVQQLHQFDWSSGHKKGKEGGLLVSSMNLNYGGSGGQQLRDTELSDGCVGNGDAFMYESVIVDNEGDSQTTWSLEKPTAKDGMVVTIHDCRVRVGDIQLMSFRAKEENPLPPFNKLLAPMEDVVNKGKDKNGNETTKVIIGYAGKAKGIAQVLWERGLWKKGMKSSLKSHHLNFPALSAKHVLANCDDFKEENGALEDLVQSYGHIVMFSPKGHPEIAGAGIEYDWGVSKKFFRRDNNHVAKNCESDVRLSLAKVDLRIAKHTARKARSYMRAYEQDAGGSHLLIEKFVSLRKCHRNMMDQDTAFIDRTMIKIEQYADEVKTEKALIATEKRERAAAVAKAAFKSN